ncbi:MAG: PIG-L family deacetylase [Kiritimatiellae bacterium]|jgi:LmbE family N-acetylglucosaminyl deacetylase|nr:PIG-L family deacetylase [Kiritimatiellia bacterium]
MKSTRKTTRWMSPDGSSRERALARTTHLGIGAHQDDLEFMALHGILACYQKSDSWFGGVTVTDGSGSSRCGDYAECSDEEMMEIRAREQENAARIGQYSFSTQLGYASSAVKNAEAPELVEDLIHILRSARPEVVYTHNPADKHDTHIGVMSAVLKAIRALPAEERPTRVLGCEVWRDLDWLPDSAKVVLDVGGHDNLAAALNGVFDSQIAGGKRYDLAVMGRRRANATYLDSHSTDHLDQAWFAMDLTPLLKQVDLDVRAFVQDLLRNFTEDVDDKLSRYF